MKKISLLALLLFITLQANTQTNYYTSKELGWKIEIPAGYEIESEAVMKENYEQGLDAMEDALDAEIVGEVYDLVDFAKDDFNYFQSAYQKYDPSVGTYMESTEFVKEALTTTFVEEGLNAKASKVTKETINGREFYKFTIDLYGEDGTVVLHMLAYNILIGDNDAGFFITYDNNTDRDVLLGVFKASTFN